MLLTMADGVTEHPRGRAGAEDPRAAARGTADGCVIFFSFFGARASTTRNANPRESSDPSANPRDRAIGFDPSIPVPDVSRPMNAKTLRYLPTCGDSRRLP
jgi:hypothetical protein